jgi:hypothetical protein
LSLPDFPTSNLFHPNLLGRIKVFHINKDFFEISDTESDGAIKIIVHLKKQEGYVKPYEFS